MIGTPSPVQAVLDHVDRFEQRANGYWCICPGHDDHNPSLHVQEGEDGSALVKCRAGCEQEQVLSALEERGMHRRALFSPNGSRNSSEARERVTATYHIKD